MEQNTHLVQCLEIASCNQKTLTEDPSHELLPSLAAALHCSTTGVRVRYEARDGSIPAVTAFQQMTKCMDLLTEEQRAKGDKMYEALVAKKERYNGDDSNPAPSAPTPLPGGLEVDTSASSPPAPASLPAGLEVDTSAPSPPPPALMDTACEGLRLGPPPTPHTAETKECDLAEDSDDASTVAPSGSSHTLSSAARSGAIVQCDPIQDVDEANFVIALDCNPANMAEDNTWYHDIARHGSSEQQRGCCFWMIPGALLKKFVNYCQM